MPATWTNDGRPATWLAASDSEIEFVPYDQAWPKGTYEDLMYRAPDLAKIRNCVGYDPKVGLREGMRRSIGWMKEQGIPL